MPIRQFGALLALVCVFATAPVRGQETAPLPPATVDDAAVSGDVQYNLIANDSMLNRGWFVDGGVYVLQPRWQTNQAVATAAPIGGGRFALNAIEFNYGASVSPYIKAGYVNDCGLGFRVGFWDFRDNTSVNVTPVAGGAVTSAAPLSLTTFANVNPMLASTSLNFQVWDAEVTQQLNGMGWLWDVSGGVRYLHMSQTYNVTTSGAAAAVDDLASSHSINAAGPTLALQGRRQLGASRFSLYGSARGSMLVGDNRQQSRLFSATGVTGDTAFQSSRSFVNINEMDVGVWWQRNYQPVTVVATAGLVGQYWSNVGNAANTDTFSAFANDEAQNNTAAMGLWGLRTSLQFWY